MKQKRFLLTLFLALFFAACSGKAVPDSGRAPSVTDLPTPTPSFSDFTTELFLNEITTDTISLHYTLSYPENYGITEIPISFGSIFSDTEGADEADETDYNAAVREQLLSYPYTELTEEEQLTYDTLLRTLDLSTQLESCSPYLSELLGPTTGYQAQLPLLLAEYRFNTKEDIETYLALLPCLYDYFEEIADFEREKSAAGFFMNDDTANEIIRQCRDFAAETDDNFLISTFEERVDSFSELSVAEKTAYKLENRSAIFQSVLPAYDMLANALTELLGTGTNRYGLCYYDTGKDYYALSVRQATGSDRTIPELRTMLENALKKAYSSILQVVYHQPAVYKEFNSFTFPETDPEKILPMLMSACENDFPVVDCQGYTIKYVPASLQEYVSPAMYLTPPLDDYAGNSIYINPNPAYDLDSIFPTIAHEGYPGHMYQSVSALALNMNPLRSILEPTGYSEGWATYVENYSYAYTGCSEDLIPFLRENAFSSLCLYALSDIYIHYDGYTPEKLNTFFRLYGFDEEIAGLVYATILEEPVAYLPYAVGYLEFLQLRELAAELWQADYSDYRFHSFLMETGALPFSLLEQRLKK